MTKPTLFFVVGGVEQAVVLGIIFLHQLEGAAAVVSESAVVAEHTFGVESYPHISLSFSFGIGFVITHSALMAKVCSPEEVVIVIFFIESPSLPWH